MKCLYCGNEMTIGYITAERGGALVWVPNIKKSIIKDLIRTDKEIFCKDWCNVKVHKCKQCNKMLIDLNDDFNRLDNP